MEKDLVPKDYGIEEDKATEIAKAFTPVDASKDVIYEIYVQLISAEITPEICEQAGALSTKLSKVNASLIRTHKAEKAYYLHAGRFVDAIKNRTQVTIDTMQGNLKELKGFYETLEKERIEKLESSRAKELVKYEKESPGNLGSMDDEFWKDYLAVIKFNYEKNIEAEKKAEEERIEAERITELANSRYSELIEYSQFYDDDKDVILGDELGKLSKADYFTLVRKLKTKKNDYDKEQEEIKAENERLKKEAEEKERLRLIEEYKRKEKEQAEAKKLADIEAKRKAKEDKEKKQLEDKLEREKTDKETAQNALQKAKQKELDAAMVAKKAEQDALKAPDKVKLQNISKQFAEITLYDLKSEDGKIIIAHLETLIQEARTYINEQSEKL